MDIAIIGSKALSNWADVGRTPKDIDIVCTYEDFKMHCNLIGGKTVATYPFSNGEKYLAVKQFPDTPDIIIEAEIAWDGSLAEELLEFIKSDKDSIVNSSGEVNFYVASLDILYMLKMSHRYLRNSPHFMKTMKDIKLLRSLGAEIKEDHKDFYERRIKATYNYSHPSLMKSKDEFFSGDGIDYEYDHDSIHEAVRIMYKPAYTFFQSGDVMVDMDKFETLGQGVKILAVMEESMVLAAERSQLAFPDVKITPRESFTIALEKVCTSITSGRFREFAWENYDEVVAYYDKFGYNYMERVYGAIESGLIKRLEDV